MDQTPLFQLNLMLWLTWPAPPGGVVRPIFRDDGFTLRAIGPTLKLPLEIGARADAAGISLTKSPSPDLLLEHRRRNLFLPIECKLSSFGPDAPPGNAKHPARQGAALLAAAGPYLADYFGLPGGTNWRAYLLYALGEGQEAAMQETLDILRERLQTAHVEPAAGGALGIAIRPDGIYLHPAATAVVPVASLQGATPDGVRVVELEPDEDPRPLYLIPWDPSVGVSEDEYERRAFEERVRSAVISVIGSRLDASLFMVSLDDVLKETVEVWALWRDSEAMRGFRNAVRAYVRRVLAQLRKMSVNIQMHQDTFTFSQVTPRMAQDVRRYLSSAAFRRGEIDLWSEAMQMDFSSLAEGW
jgi:hypothetical protein